MMFCLFRFSGLIEYVKLILQICLKSRQKVYIIKLGNRTKGRGNMAGKISDFMNRFKFKNRLIMFMGLIITVPIMVLSIIFYHVYVSFYDAKIGESYDFICTDSYKNLNYKLDLYTAIVDKTAFNKSITNALIGMDSQNMMVNYQNSQIIDREIENIVLGNSMEEVYQFLIYPLDRDIKGMGKYLSGFGNISHEDWAHNIQQKSRMVFFEEKMGNEILSMAQVIYYIDELTNETKPIALVKAEIKLDDILNNTISDSHGGMEIEILQNGQPAYIYKPIDERNHKEEVLTKEKILLDEKIQFIYRLNQNDERRMRWIIMLISVLAIVLPTALLVAIIIRFSNNTNERLEEIFRKIKKIQSGNFDISKTLDGNDEFADVDERLEVMAAELKQIINERYIIENERKKAQLLALQMQINPHFMYNTLETINSIAKQAGSHDISIISQKMGEILRYNINHNDKEYVYLQQEIDNVKCYLNIQEIRFGDRLTVFYDIPEELNKYIVLKFTLQPIVENAIKYAVQNVKDSSMIAITAEVDGENLIVRIQDDGKGMTEQRLLEIRRSLEDSQYIENEKIGLKNVHSRIQMTYGKPYGIEIFSKENKGTSVHLKFPIREEAEDAG